MLNRQSKGKAEGLVNYLRTNFFYCLIDYALSKRYRDVRQITVGKLTVTPLL